jgi:diacylglycerol kinase (ATP)
MRAIAMLGPGSSVKDLRPFQRDHTITWKGDFPALRDEADVILIFGGDGTIHHCLRRCVELQLPVLIVPCGSGNDFARALGMRKMRDSLAAWEKFTTQGNNIRAIDLGVITRPDLPQQYFSTVAGVGLDGEVLKTANRLPRWLRGNGGYALSLLPVLFRFAALPMKVSITNSSDEAVSKPTVLAAFANVPAYGGGMQIAPQAQLDDGKLDVCIIDEISPFKFLCAFPKVYFGRHLGMKEVEYFQAERLKLKTEQPLDVYADGEYVCQTPMEVGVVRNALKVVVP